MTIYTAEITFKGEKRRVTLEVGESGSSVVVTDMDNNVIEMVKQEGKFVDIYRAPGLPPYVPSAKARKNA